jgi:hypothetical protein
MADDVSFKFGADIADLKAKLDQVGGLFKTFGEQFAALTAVVAGGAAFKEFISAADRLNSSAERMSRTLGISAGEAGAISMAVDDVAASMGIGGATAETYTGAFLKFNRQLRMNSDEMRAMGVDVDALASGQKTSNQVFQEALQIVGKYAPGIDQTQVAMKMFGRSVEDVQLLMGITAEKIEEARQKAAALNLTITADGVEGARRYRVAMNDVHDVLEGVEKTIGEAVMPHFAQMGEQLASIGPQIVQMSGAAVQALLTLWDQLSEIVATVWDGIKDILVQLAEAFGVTFSRDGPGAMEIFRNAIKVIQIAIIGFSIGFQEFVNVVSAGLQMIIAGARAWVNVWVAALHFDWDGVKQAFRDGLAERNKILEEATKKAVDIAANGRTAIDAAVDANLKVGGGAAAGAPTGGTKKAPIGKDTGDDPRLAAKLMLQRAFQEAAMQLQLEYLKEAGAAADDAYSHNLISIKEYYDAKLAIESMANKATLDARRQELADAQAAEAKAQSQAESATKSQDRRKHEAEVLKFRTEQAKLQGQINILEQQGLDITRRNAQERADAEQKLADELGTIAATRAKANADAEVTNLRGALDQMKALRQIDAQQQFDGQRELENRSYQATLTFLAAKRAQIHNDDKKALAQQAADEEAAEVAHQQKITDIDRAATLERAKYSIEAQQSIQDGFAGFVKDMLSGTKTIGDAMRAFARTVATTFEGLIAKKFAERLFGEGSAGGQLIDKLVSPFINAIETIVAKWIGAEVTQTAVTEAESAARTAFRTSEIAAQTAAQVAGMAEVKASSIAEIMSYASVAAAGAMASVASIPFVGWAMAPAVGAETYATAMGFLATAQGGWDSVPFDGAMAELHKQEMVLPRFLSEGVRQIAEPGRLQSLITSSVAQAQPRVEAGGDTHFHINAVDAASFKQLLDRHGSSLVSALKKQGRNFAF